LKGKNAPEDYRFPENMGRRIILEALNKVEPEFTSEHEDYGGGAGPRSPPAKSEITNRIRKTTNRIQAIWDEIQATPSNPRAPATRAIIKNRMASPNIMVPLS
jgi:hypothetical protein